MTLAADSVFDFVFERVSGVDYKHQTHPMTAVTGNCSNLDPVVALCRWFQTLSAPDTTGN